MLDVLYFFEGYKDFKKIVSCIFSEIFGQQNPDTDSLEMLDPDSDSMNPDPQHCTENRASSKHQI